MSFNSNTAFKTDPEYPIKNGIRIEPGRDMDKKPKLEVTFNPTKDPDKKQNSKVIRFGLINLQKLNKYKEDKLIKSVEFYLDEIFEEESPQRRLKIGRPVSEKNLEKFMFEKGLKKSINKGQFIEKTPLERDIINSIYDVYKQTNGIERKDLLYKIFHELTDELKQKKTKGIEKNSKGLDENLQKLYSGIAAVKILYKKHDEGPPEIRITKDIYENNVENIAKRLYKKYYGLSDEEELNWALKYSKKEMQKDNFSKLESLIKQKQINLKKCRNEIRDLYFDRQIDEKTINLKLSEFSDYFSKKIDKLKEKKRNEYETNKLKGLHLIQAVIQLAGKNPEMDYDTLLETSKKVGFANYQSTIREEIKQQCEISTKEKRFSSLRNIFGKVKNSFKILYSPTPVPVHA